VDPSLCDCHPELVEGYDLGFGIWDLRFTIWDWALRLVFSCLEAGSSDNPFDTWILLFATVTLSLSKGMIWDSGFTNCDLGFTIWELGLGPSTRLLVPHAGSSDNPFDTWILLFATVTLSLSKGMIWDSGFTNCDLGFTIYDLGLALRLVLSCLESGSG
jgi:hypothetical protein